MSDVRSEGAVNVPGLLCSNEFGYIARPLGHIRQLVSAHYHTLTQLC